MRLATIAFYFTTAFKTLALPFEVFSATKGVCRTALPNLKETTMECKHAYFKDNEPYVLCDCDEKPRTNKLEDLTKAMCGHQRFCPNIRACALLPTWKTCSKLLRAIEPVENVTPAITQKATRKKKD